MTAPLDGDLAWEINTWCVTHTPLDRGQIESLARHLSAAGYARPKTDLGLADLTGFANKARSALDKFLKDTTTREPATS